MKGNEKKTLLMSSITLPSLNKIQEVWDVKAFEGKVDMMIMMTTQTPRQISLVSKTFCEGRSRLENATILVGEGGIEMVRPT